MPDPTAVPTPATDFGLASTALHMALALLAILVFIFAAFWLLRRYGPKIGLGPGGRGGMLRLVAHLSLGPRKSVIVVRFLNKDLVLGVTDHAITLLTEGTAEHDTPSDFQTALADQNRRNGGDPAA